MFYVDSTCKLLSSPCRLFSFYRHFRSFHLPPSQFIFATLSRQLWVFLCFCAFGVDSSSKMCISLVNLALLWLLASVAIVSMLPLGKCLRCLSGFIFLCNKRCFAISSVNRPLFSGNFQLLTDLKMDSEKQAESLVHSPPNLNLIFSVFSYQLQSVS